MIRRASSHALHFLVEAGLGFLAILALAGCVLAWRLAQGPIDLSWLARREQPRLEAAGLHVQAAGVALAWEGFRAEDSPLDLELRDASIALADGTRVAQVPLAHVTLAIGQLLLARIVPRSVDIEQASLALARRADGSIGLDGAAPAGQAAAKTGGAGAMPALLGEMARPGGPDSSLPWVSQLRHLRIQDARLSLRDAAFGVVWQSPHANLEVRRAAAGGVSGGADIVLALGNIQTRLTAQAAVDAAGTHLSAAASPVSPAALSAQSPGFAALGDVDVPVGWALDARLDSAFALTSAALTVTGGAGRVKAGHGVVGLAGVSAQVRATPDAVDLSALRVAFATVAGAHAPPPVLTGHARMVWPVGRKQVSFALSIDKAAFGDLAQYWPEGTGGGARPWITENIVGGMAEGAQVEGRLDMGADFSAPVLTALSGGMTGEDLTAFWLRPVPPIEHGKVRLVIDGPDVLRVLVDGGESGNLRVSNGVVRITGLAAKDQFGAIDVGLEGPLPDVLALLGHPRLNLLSRRKLDFTAPAGHVAGRLKLTVPLEARVNLDDIGIGAKATMTGVHLGDVALGRALDDTDLDLSVDGDGLQMRGAGSFGGLPAHLALDMDFRAGPASQVIQHVTAEGVATPAQLVAFGVPDGVVTTGNATIKVDYSERHDGLASVRASADLGHAALVTPLGWRKAADAPARLAARISLQGGHVTGVDEIEGHGPGLDISGRMEGTGRAGRSLVFDRLDIGRTRAAGSVGLPTPAQDVLKISLHGPMLDLSSYFAEDKKPPPPSETPDPPETRGQPWSANLRFDQVAMAKDQNLSPLTLIAENNGLHIARATLQGGPGQKITASISPSATGRDVKIDAADGGSVMLALGVADNIHGGALQMTGHYTDGQPHPKLAGLATLTDFQLTNAPAIGRLLQAMTLYGLADIARGPGLHFSKMVAPFAWQSRVLTLTNARVFSPSLGLTAQGSIDLRRRQADVTGTVVPAYFFNQILGKVPLFGIIFSPEKGGGLFAARYSVKGPLDAPKVGVNPLAALTPGFLRGIFGVLAAPAKPAANPASP